LSSRRRFPPLTNYVHNAKLQHEASFALAQTEGVVCRRCLSNPKAAPPRSRSRTAIADRGPDHANARRPSGRSSQGRVGGAGRVADSAGASACNTRESRAPDRWKFGDTKFWDTILTSKARTQKPRRGKEISIVSQNFRSQNSPKFSGEIGVVFPRSRRRHENCATSLI
jgi:hypothetical protein